MINLCEDMTNTFIFLIYPEDNWYLHCGIRHLDRLKWKKDVQLFSLLWERLQIVLALPVFPSQHYLYYREQRQLHSDQTFWRNVRNWNLSMKRAPGRSLFHVWDLLCVMYWVECEATLWWNCLLLLLLLLFSHCNANLVTAVLPTGFDQPTVSQQSLSASPYSLKDPN